MAGHITPIATRIEVALKAGSDLKAAADEAYAELHAAGITGTAYAGVSGSDIIVFLPGYGPLSDPEDHIKLATRVA